MNVAFFGKIVYQVSLQWTVMKNF